MKEDTDRQNRGWWCFESEYVVREVCMPFLPLYSQTVDICISLSKAGSCSGWGGYGSFFSVLSRELDSPPHYWQAVATGEHQQRRPFSGLAHGKKKPTLLFFFFLLQINCHALHLKSASSFYLQTLHSRQTPPIIPSQKGDLKTVQVPSERGPVHVCFLPNFILAQYVSKG